MIAYNSAVIQNTKILKKVRQWFAYQLLSAQQLKLANETYPINFYNPNIFIKVGLFVFTGLIIFASLGLFLLFFSSIISYSSSNTAFAIITCIVFAISCVLVLEQFIKAKVLYRSGVDEALLYASLAFLFSGLCFMFFNSTGESNDYNNFLAILLVFLPFTVFAAIRYLDTIVAAIAMGTIYAICFLCLIKLGDVAKLIMPFVFMAISAIFYFVIQKQKQRIALSVWKSLLIMAEAFVLMVFYLSCNYFVIRESSIEFFDMTINEGENIPMAWLFYVLTAIVPLVYIVWGLKQKDKVLLWIGLLLVAVSVLTFKYYFSLGHPEITLTIAGIVMIVIAYVSIKYLKTDKHNITFKEEIDEDNFLKSNAEALAMVQSFTQQPTQAKTEDFGGGEFGGGGSGNTF